MTPDHADGVLEVFRLGIETGHATFETGVPSWDQWDADHLDAHRFVALTGADTGAGDVGPAGDVVGWVAATPVSSRSVYAGVLEHGIYVHPDHRGRGVGALLLDTYVAATEAAGVWTLQSGIFPENTASMALHGRAGFRVVGTRERIGRHHDAWRDVVLVERRSRHVGAE